VLDQNFVARRNEDFPAFRIRIVVGCGENLKILGALVASNVEKILAVTEKIPVLLLARKKKSEVRLRLVGLQLAKLRRVGAFGGEQQVPFVAGLLHADLKSLVLLFIQWLEPVLAQGVAQSAVRAFGYRVLGD